MAALVTASDDTNCARVTAEGYCWTRTAERQSSRMRARYLRAVLRQDVEYFDLTVGSTSQVVTGVSGDTLVVQDALSEKVTNFVMNVAMFVASYAVALALLWRLTLVSLPSVLLLIVPGFLYGRAEASPRERRLKCITNISPKKLMTYLLN